MLMMHCSIEAELLSSMGMHLLCSGLVCVKFDGHEMWDKKHEAQLASKQAQVVTVPLILGKHKP